MGLPDPRVDQEGIHWCYSKREQIRCGVSLGCFNPRIDLEGGGSLGLLEPQGKSRGDSLGLLEPQGGSRGGSLGLLKPHFLAEIFHFHRYFGNNFAWCTVLRENFLNKPPFQKSWIEH